MTVLYLCGAGNSEGVRLARRVNERLQRWEHIFLLDDDPAKHGQELLGVEIAGGLALLEGAERDAEVQNLVARTTRKRRLVHEKIAAYRVPFVGLIHPDIDVEGADCDPDVVVYRQAVLGPEIRLGAGTVVFMGAVIGHESRVGSGCVIASNAVLNARVELGEGVYVGTNATILPEVKVGAWATIGAGAVVLQDVPPGATVFSPAVEVVALEKPTEGRFEPSIVSPVTSYEPALHLLPSAPADGAVNLQPLVAEAWRTILGRGAGLDERFFDVGGSSLLALKLLDRLRTTTKQPLVLTDIYRFFTIRTMAQHLAKLQSTSSREMRGSAPSRVRQLPAWRRGG